ncbi:GNAT family N-acetyltransferase [Saccharopolyspora taberi]
MVTVTNASGRHRYEISVEGELAGFTEYVDRDGQRIFYHTEVDPGFAGQGLGGVLVAEALAGTRAAGMRVVPVCPFVARYVGRHHDFDDLLDPVTPEVLAVVEAGR